MADEPEQLAERLFSNKKRFKVRIYLNVYFKDSKRSVARAVYREDEKVGPDRSLLLWETLHHSFITMVVKVVAMLH